MWIWPWFWNGLDARLRRAQMQDAPRLARLHGEGFAYGWSSADFEAMLAERATWADCLISQGIFGAVVTGFAISRMAAGEAELLTITLDEEVRGKGLSARLLAHHAGNLRRAGVETLFLEVAEDNAPALALYKRLGFEEIGRRKGYYASAPGAARKVALTMKWDIRTLDPVPRF